MAWKRRRAILKTKAPTAARHPNPAGSAERTASDPAQAVSDQTPAHARNVPAIRHRIGRNRYQCLTPGCAAQLRMSNGDTVTCPRCQRNHRLRNPTLQHWHDRTDQP